MPFDQAQLQARIGSLLILLWQTQQELGETQMAFEQAKVKIAELEKPKEEPPKPCPDPQSPS